MRTIIQSRFTQCLLAATATIILLSCNNTNSIPFPEKELGYTQPVTTKLQFTPEKPLIFDTAKQGGVIPVIKKLDLDALPSVPYDSTGFKTFSTAPEETHFDFNTLPDTAFNPDKITSTPLRFKTYPLNPPAPTKVAPPAAQKGNPLSIFDLGPRLGFPPLFITSLLKDRHGMLWIGSQEGLFRYDGEYVQNMWPFSGGPTVVGMVEDNEGRIWFIDQQKIGVIDQHNGTVSFSAARTVAKNNLSKMIKDREGRIWISKTTAKDVVVIDPVTQTFKSIGRSAGLPDISGANDITADSTGNIWITTPLQGAAIVNWKAGKIKYIRKATGLYNDSLRAITTGKDGKVWIALAGGNVDAVDTKAGSIKHYTAARQGLKEAFTGDISADSKGRIWVGKSLGLDVLDPTNNRVRFIDAGRGLGANWVSACVEDNNHCMWVSTIGGLHMIDQGAETVHPLGATQVISLMEDTLNNLWVATDKGIQMIDQGKKITRILDKTHGLANNFVQSFSRFERQMWVTSNGGLDIIDPISKTLEHMGKKEGLVNDTVYVVFKDRSGNTWLTGPSNGLDIIDSAKKIILHTDVPGGLSDDDILDVKEDADGLVWIAGRTGGINLIDLKKRTVKYLNNQPGLRDTCSKVMIMDSYNRMWIGTDKGVYVADTKRGEISAITTGNGLSHNRISSLVPYKGSMIAGTNVKVNIITAPVPGNTDSAGNKWKVAIAGRSEGFIREVTNSWATDAITSKGQYLWGDNGMKVLYDIQPTTDSAATYITGINLMTKPQYFINHRALNDRDTLWTADTFYVKGQAVPGNGFANSKDMQWDSVSGAYSMPANLQIAYNQNYMQFHFVQAHISRQDPVLYTYFLEGIDKNWSIISANTSTENYLNLPSGKYTFKVSSKGANGKWDTPASFNFTILPPWWQTWWAYTLLAILCAALLRGYIVYRGRKLKRENKVLEEKVDLRTKQLQQSLEDLKATQTQLIQSEKMASLGELTAGIAHEIQNPLNFINNFSEVNTELIADMKEEIEKGNLEEVKLIAGNIEANEQKINHHGKRADSIVKGMLQHSRTGNRQKEATSINALADEYLRLAYHGLRAKDKSFNAIMKTDFDESIGTINIISQDIGRVVLNLITNAFYAVTEKKKKVADKVSGDKYEPTVWVSTQKLGDKVLITVRDNGDGIPQKVQDKIFQPFFTTKPTGQGTGLGLSLSYDIVHAHGGTLKVDNKEGEGVTFTIQLPAQ